MLKSPQYKQPDTCWFCESRTSATGAAVVEIMNHQYLESISIKVPRCEICKSVHEIEERESLMSCLVVILFIIFGGTGGWLIAKYLPFYFDLSEFVSKKALLISIYIFLFVIWIIFQVSIEKKYSKKRKKYGIGIKPENDSINYPVVEQKKFEGFYFGLSPPESSGARDKTPPQPW